MIAGAWLEPPDADGPVLLYFHGGGFVFGSVRTHGVLIGALARAARARTFALEYRLGPEHRAPAAHEDALAAYRYLLAEGIPPGRIVLAGDSAGGTMVLNTLIALRDAGAPLPAAGVAISPWVDLTCSGASFDTNAPFDFVGKVHCLLAAESYLAGLDPRRPGHLAALCRPHGPPAAAGARRRGGSHSSTRSAHSWLARRPRASTYDYPYTPTWFMSGISCATRQPRRSGESTRSVRSCGNVLAEQCARIEEMGVPSCPRLRTQVRRGALFLCLALSII